MWKVQALGGPRLVKGQLFAMQAAGGGWLKFDQFGLVLSGTPSYEWRTLGSPNKTGVAIPPDTEGWGYRQLSAGDFALWNDVAQDFLVYGTNRTGGVDAANSRSLNWYKQTFFTPPPVRAVKTERVFNCYTARRPVEVWVVDKTTGTRFRDLGSVSSHYGDGGWGCPDLGSTPLTFSPMTGHHYRLVVTDKTLPSCGGIDSPLIFSCQVMVVEFDGDESGFTRSDTVNNGTVITP